MKFDELINKFNDDNKFREEIIILGKNGGAKAIIKKYEIPYTEDELIELLKARMERSNCSEDTQDIIKDSVLSLGILCIVHDLS